MGGPAPLVSVRARCARAFEQSRTGGEMERDRRYGWGEDRSYSRDDQWGTHTRAGAPEDRGRGAYAGRSDHELMPGRPGMIGSRDDDWRGRGYGGGYPLSGSEIDRERSAAPVWVLIHSTGRSVSAWQVLAAGLLRSGSGLSIREAAHRLGLGVARVARAERVHADLLEQSQEYGTVSGRVLSAAVGRSISAGRTKPAGSALDLRRL